MLSDRIRSVPWLRLLLLLAVLPSAALAQTRSESAYPVETSFKIYPTPLWSRTAGFAAGVGYEVENLLVPHSRLLATAKPGQHLGRYTLTYFVEDAYRDPLYGLGNVYYETTGRQWYYGLGPTASQSNELGLEKDRLEAEARVGFQPFGRWIMLQPSVKYVRHEVHGYRAFEEGAVARLSADSQRNLAEAAGEFQGSSNVQEGIALGIAAGIDLRDRSRRPRRGFLLQGLAQRYAFSTPDDLSYGQYELYAYGYVPVGTNVLTLRLATQFTDPHTSRPIPFYLLPSLHGRLLPGYSWNRFFGHDLLVLTAEYTLPLFEVHDFAALDALLSVGAGNVYNDLFAEFEPSLTFDSDLSEADTYPLRPSAGIGFNVESLTGSRWDLRALVGWGTDGFRLVRFGFVHDLRDIELSKR